MGSSPLTRGKRGDTPAGASFLGLIPAHAGKTSAMSAGASGRPAHPRSHGENRPNCGLSEFWDGSSPLTRGKLLGGLEGLRRRGLIPAHAGKTRARCGSSASEPAHPRSRGENTLRMRDIAALPGSSPLTRGKRRVTHPSEPRQRLIPAHAGKTVTSPLIPSWPSAHPRSRGENAERSRYRLSTSGSSPLTRGKRWPRRWPAWPARLIPAHAGKTWCASCPPQRSKAHPRSRGENGACTRRV